jgi:hypothetical protein
MKTKLLLGSVILLLIGFTACEKETIKNGDASSPVEFKLSINENNLKSTKSDEITNVKSAIVTIANNQGTLIYEQEEIELTNFNGSFISNKLLLEVGDYTLTEFLILDNNGNVAYASPKEDSELASLVNDPLAINFSVEINQTTTVTPEVLSISDFEPADFGYVEFGFKYIKTFNFVVGIYTIDDSQTPTASNANITVTANNKTYIDKEIEGILNILTINDGLESYSIVAEKTGYKTFSKAYTLEQLKEYETTPLDVYLEKIDEIILDYTKITDAAVTTYNRNNNLGDEPFIEAFSWTISGVPVNVRFVMGFDLSDIPEGQQIKSATLSLFYADNHPDPLEKTMFGGQNDLKIELIGEDWDENSVTWDNQPSTIAVGTKTIQSDGNGKVDKPNIDITELVQLMINNPDGNNGIKISQLVERTYRSSFFASTENELTDKRPILKIEFK